MSVTICTTFSEAGYRSYGRRFLDSLLKHSDVPIVAYHESMPEVNHLADLLTWKNLDHDLDRRKFITENQDNPERVGTALEPNSQSIRFCHKVFAVTREAFECKTDWLVWMDADVIVHGKPDWKLCLPDGASLSFLGRPHYYYTECGFIGYRVSDGRVLRMIEDMRHYYTSGEMFTRPKKDWHDSRCFDICRLRSDIPLNRQHSMSALTPHGIHVWPHTVLAKWSTHQKGPRRKMAAYGGVVP